MQHQEKLITRVKHRILEHYSEDLFYSNYSDCILFRRSIAICILDFIAGVNNA